MFVCVCVGAGDVERWLEFVEWMHKLGPSWADSDVRYRMPSVRSLAGSVLTLDDVWGVDERSQALHDKCLELVKEEGYAPLERDARMQDMLRQAVAAAICEWKLRLVVRGARAVQQEEVPGVSALLGRLRALQPVLHSQKGWERLRRFLGQRCILFAIGSIRDLLEVEHRRVRAAWEPVTVTNELKYVFAGGDLSALESSDKTAVENLSAALSSPTHAEDVWQSFLTLAGCDPAAAFQEWLRDHFGLPCVRFFNATPLGTVCSQNPLKNMGRAVKLYLPPWR